MKLRSALALTLALLTLIPLIGSCGETNTETAQTTAAVAQTDNSVTDGETADPTKDADGYELDGLAESYNFGKEITMLYDSKYSKQEFFSEGQNGEAINDALYARNLAVEARLGVTINYVGETGNDGNQKVFLAKAQTDANGGLSEYDIYAAYSRTIPLLAMNGLCDNLLDNEYIDIDKPWWPQALTDECTVNGKLFFATGDISTNLLWMMSCLFYNKDMWTAHNLGKTPEEMVDSREWVLDTFIDIAKGMYTDDGDGVKNESDTFGLVAYNTCVDAFLNSCGVITIVHNSEGKLELSEDFIGEKTTTIVQKLGAFCSANALHNSSKAATEKGLFYESHSLFIVDGTYIAADGEKMDFTYGIVPLPMYDSNQEGYVTNLRYPFNFYAISKSGDEKAISGCVIEAEASASYRSVTPAVFELTMKTRYSADQETSRMYDIIREGVVFDFGRIYGYSLDNYYPDFRNQCFAGGAGWTNNVKSINKKTKKLLETVYASFED